MNGTLFLIGMGKVLFGLVVGAVGIFLAKRLFGRLARLGNTDEELARGNVAAGVLVASAIVSLGILAQKAIEGTFSAMDLAYRHEVFNPMMLVSFLVYGILHVGTAFLVGALVFALGIGIFTRLTGGVDEMAEIKKGNVAPALLLGGVVVVLALVTAPGLQMALEGMLPLPQLGRDELIAPH